MVSNVKHPPRALERLAGIATRYSGTSAAFAGALACIVIWIFTGPLFHFSDTWQLVINTGTTIITFLMVFLIQRAQNKESLAIQLKLNEIVAALEGASNRLINVESLSEEDVTTLHKYYEQLSVIANKCKSVTESHSIEEAAERANKKLKGNKSVSPTADC